MKAPFVLRVPTDEMAREIAPLLDGSPARVQVEETPMGDVCIGLPEAGGPTRWVAAVHALHARDVLSFLERWGFVARPTRAP